MQATHGRLVLTRKANESIIVGNVRITITRTTGAKTQICRAEGNEPSTAQVCEQAWNGLSGLRNGAGDNSAGHD